MNAKFVRAGNRGRKVVPIILAFTNVRPQGGQNSSVIPLIHLSVCLMVIDRGKVFLYPKSAQTAWKNFVANSGPLSVSSEIGVPYTHTHCCRRLLRRIMS
jgi:hypothetical protein